MSGLLDSLSLASSALSAEQMGMNVVGQNMANVNTPGYTRRVLTLTELPATDSTNAGRGVMVAGVQSLRDAYVEAQLQKETTSQQYEQTVSDSLNVAQSALGQPGASLDANLTSFFSAFSTLAQDATSPQAREAVVSEGQQLAGEFNSIAGQFAAAQTDADQQVRSTVDQINGLADQIASLNGSIASGGSADVSALEDQRDIALEQLSGYANVSTTTEPDGSLDVSIGNGRPLVIDGTAYHLSVSDAPGTGLATVDAAGTDVTSELTGGTIGAALKVRDSYIPSYQSQLDTLAYDVATKVNSIHTAGYDANGAPGEDFFEVGGSAPGAAAAISVNPDLVADSQKVAASSVAGSVGDNQTANAIAALQSAPIAAGGPATAAGLWSQLVYQAGADASAAQTSLTSSQSIVTQLQNLKNSTSGVSLDEEAALLMQYQRAYQGNAEYFTTINNTLTTLLAMVVTTA